MQPINIKILIETIKDCENNVTLLDTCFYPQLSSRHIDAIKSAYPNQIGDGLFSFIDKVIPADTYGAFERYFNALYNAKLHPFWVEVSIPLSDIALRTTVVELGITPEKVFTSEKEMTKALEVLLINNISIRLDWWNPDTRYPDHQSGRLVLCDTQLKMTANISQGESPVKKERAIIDFIEDISILKELDINQLEISGVREDNGKFERCKDEDAQVWSVYGIVYGDPLKDSKEYIALADCDTRSSAESLLSLMEMLIHQRKNPSPQDFTFQ